MRDRLGIHRFGRRGEIDALARAVAGEGLKAVGLARWRRRRWLVVATDGGLRLARRPRFGRARDERFEWADLTALSAGNPRGELTYGDRVVRLSLLPVVEHARLLDTARQRLRGVALAATTEGLRELARRELGRRARLAFADVIDGVPDHLEAGERVERVALATLDFSGLLAVTDRRVVLFENSPRGPERVWWLARAEIRGVTIVKRGLRLELDADTVVLTGIAPQDALLELVSDLRAATSDAPADSGLDAVPERSGWVVPAARLREPALPSLAWELTAPESFVLRYARTDPSFVIVFKLAVTELVARDALRLEGVRLARGWRPGPRRVWLLSDGPRIATVDEPALIAPLTFYQHVRARRARSGSRATDATVAIEGVLATHLNPLRPEARRTLVDYVADDVMRSLRRRGLLTGDGTYTDAGRRADEALDTWMALAAQRLPDWAASRRPALAITYLRAAGAAVLLVPDARPTLDLLGTRLRAGHLDLDTADPRRERNPAALTARPERLGALALAALANQSAGLEGLGTALNTIDACLTTINAGGPVY